MTVIVTTIDVVLTGKYMQKELVKEFIEIAGDLDVQVEATPDGAGLIFKNKYDYFVVYGEVFRGFVYSQSENAEAEQAEFEKEIANLNLTRNGDSIVVTTAGLEYETSYNKSAPAIAQKSDAEIYAETVAKLEEYLG